MVRNRFTKGTYNGFEVEFGKVYSNPMLSAFIPMNEAKGDKKLRVFDFDDTLVKTKSHIYIKNKDGKESKLTPGEYAIYEPKEGDKFDFSDFESVKKPQEIKGVTRLLKNIMRVGGSDVVILTARSAYKPVKDYLKDVGIDNIYVVALADADPQKKADWIEDKIKSGVNDVFFIDDSHKNVAAVKALAKKYPKVSLKVRHVQHETPTTPPQDKIKGGKKEKDFIKGKSMANNDMRLKNLLPKTDLDKKVKNPDTGKMIKIKTALGYEKDTKAYKAAQFALKKK
jgi:phosphoglycolate phosphatase-like HAD superfamily hydrolase